MRRISALLIFALTLTILGTSAGCGAKSEPRAKDGKPVVAFVTNNPYEFWTIARRGTEKAAKEFDVTVDFQTPPRGTAAEQRSIIEDLLAKGASRASPSARTIQETSAVPERCRDACAAGDTGQRPARGKRPAVLRRHRQLP